ncbi:MAG TPA: glycosyltransferase family 4 protein [Solirubrobacteraceae bacterium]|jgi:glycosyltransferase involved in cell wall biosynthesis|nr:glycosyltransferase family 4 protein [Solirubrobacteraceae bacterium]
MAMRILIFHGYLLGGTGSNVYNARLVEALVRLGHEVHLFSQERHPETLPFISAAADWDSGELCVRELPANATESRVAVGGGSATLYRPDIGGLLPVYVADRYEGLEAKTFADCSPEEVDAYLAANVAAVSEVLTLTEPQIALANHLVMGPVILARALAGRLPYAVKVHGSALEYTVKPNPERFLDSAREGIASASGVLVGSHHTAASLWAAIGDPELPDRTRLGPPGVDVARFAPREPAAAAAGLRTLAVRLRAMPATPVSGEGSAFDRDPAEAAAAIEQLDGERDLLVAYVGKLIVSKGVDLLLACWPLVLDAVPRARLVIVGFGAYREGLQELVAALQAGDLERAERLARAGRALEDPAAQAAPLRHLLAFLGTLEGEERERYLRAAANLSDRVLLAGRMEHDELTELLPACRALVAPSTFPEAFGMVAAEGAACGAVPVVARHSGLAEVSEALAEAVPAQAAEWLSFPVDDDAVRALADRLIACLGASHELLERTRDGLMQTVREKWSWEHVAAGVIAAAQGELEGLQRP